MIRPTRAVVFGAASVLATLFSQLAASPHADAQWLPDRAYTEGPGIRVGDLELHPGVAIRGGYDTNTFRAPNTRAYDEKGSAIFAVTPHLNLKTLGTQRTTQGENAAGAAGQLPAPIAFNLGVSATYFHYFLKDAPKNVEVDFDSSLSVLPERKFGFDVGLSAARFVRPFTYQTGGGNNDFAFDTLRPSLTLRGQSRGGVLRGRVGFAPSFTLYESDIFRYLNQNKYEVPVGLAWLFLPNTALLYDGSYAFTDYPKRDENAGSVLLANSQRFQSRLGLNGAITPTFGVRVLAGYALVAQDSELLDDAEDVVGEAALTYAWSRKDNVEAGYQRLLEVSNLSGWTQLDRGYLKSSFLFGGVVALGIEAGVAHVNYGLLMANGDLDGDMMEPDALGADSAGAPRDSSRDDIRVDAAVHLEYRVIDWLALMADYQALATITDFDYYRSSSVGVPVYPGRFVSHQIFGGIRAHY